MVSTGDQLTLHLLGAPEAHIAGVPLALHHQKARALLYYLAATGQPFTRDYLATLLWSELPESNARHSLRSSLYYIRQALLARGICEALIGNNDLISLKLNDAACDITIFRSLLAEGSEHALANAIKLYHGPFLQGFTVTGAPQFEEWQRFEANTLALAFLNALQRLTAWAEERQDWQQAIIYVQHMVQIEPLAEETQRRLIRLYIRTGAIGQALRQYHTFETELRHELGLSPSSETRALLTEELGTNYGMPAQAGQQPYRSQSARRVPEEMPFVGRDEVFGKLLSLSLEVSSGRGSTVLLQGEDGAGRSRLLHELAASRHTGQPSWLVLQGSCSPFDDLLSYGPFLEAFQNAEPGDLSDLLFDVHNVDAGEQQRFLWSVLQALQMLTRSTPLLLTIDDLQWANSPTLHLFGFLATRLRHLPVLLVGTVQRAESLPALQRLVTLGRRHGDVHLLSLHPLTEEDVKTLSSRLDIDTGSDAWAAATFSSWLYERSNGSPFILTEIIAQLQAEAILIARENNLRLDIGRWRRWRATFTLPETTHDLVAWRLANLSPPARKVLDVLAVANLPLPYKLLREFPGIQSAQFLTAIEELEARGLVIEAGAELVALPHHLLRETLLHALSQLRRQDLHHQLARIIEQCPALQEHFPTRQIALHAVAGDDSERARLYGLQILDELVRDNANTQTATFLLHLHELLAQTATPHELLLLASALGQVHRSLGHIEEAAAWHRRHLALAEKIADQAARAAAHFELGELALVANDFHSAARAARAGLALEQSANHTLPMEQAARGHRLLGAALAMEGSDLPSAERHLQEAAATHRLTDTTNELCATLFELGNVAAQRGEIERALELYQEAARTAELAHSHYILALAQNNFAYHSLLLGHLNDAWQALTAGKKLAERYELFGALLHLSSSQGEIHLYLGEWSAATEAFNYSLALAEELANLERQAGNRAGLALVERGQGHLENSLVGLQEALTLLTEQGSWHLRTRIQLWLAETLLVKEHFHQAEIYLASAHETARTHNRALLLLQSERLLAHLLAAQGNWLDANVLFSQALERASRLHLHLETARTKLVWGQALLRYAVHAHDGQNLLSEARQVLRLLSALAELHASEDTIKA